MQKQGRKEGGTTEVHVCMVFAVKGVVPYKFTKLPIFQYGRLFISQFKMRDNHHLHHHYRVFLFWKKKILSSLLKTRLLYIPAHLQSGSQQDQ